MDSRKKQNTGTFILYFITGFIIFSPLLFTGFVYDDFFWISAFETNFPFIKLAGFWSIDLKDVPAFQNLWWFGNASTVFFRPLPSAFLETSYFLFGRNSAVILHVCIIVFHILNAYLIYRIVCLMSEDFPASVISGFVFLVMEDLLINIAWISAVTDLLAVFFLNLSFINFLKYTKYRTNRELAFSFFFFITALLCKETAVIYPVILTLYIIIFEQGLKQAFKKYGKTITAFLFILAVYLFLYKYYGFGSSNLLYTDPFGKPLDYILKSALLLPAMFIGMLSPMDISIPAFIPILKLYVFLSGLIIMSITLYAIYPQRNNRAVLFCLISFIIALLPQFSAEISGRLLYYPLFSGSFIIGFYASKTKLIRRLFKQNLFEFRYRREKYFAYYTLIFIVLLPLIITPLFAFQFNSSLKKNEYYVKNFINEMNPGKDEIIVFLNTPGSVFGLYADDIYRFHKLHYGNFIFLANMNGKVWVKSESEKSITVKTDSKGLLDNMYNNVLRTDEYLTEGKTIAKSGYKVTLRKTTADRKDILEAEFEFDNSLNSGKYRFVYYAGDKFVELMNFNFSDWMLIGDTSDIFKSFL